MKKLLTIGTAVLLAAATTESLVDAHAIPAFAARTNSGDNRKCLSADSFNGSVIINADFNDGTCFGVQIVEIPLPVELTGAKTVRLNGKLTSPDGKTQCRTRALARDTTLLTSSPFVKPTTVGSFQPIIMTGATVPGGGYLFVDCDMDTAMIFTSVVYPR
jgi:hypothetical protein